MTIKRTQHNKRITITAIALLAGLLLNSCKNDTAVKETEKTVISNSEKEIISDDSKYDKKTVNDELANKVKNYLTTSYLTEADLKAIEVDQRKFQLYQIDLNNNGENEIFVNFVTPYFCGSGGCTVLLLDKNLSLINAFSPARTFYVEDKLENGYKVILTNTEGSWRKLIFKNGSYPKNPTLLETTSDTVSKTAEILFNNDGNAKTYEF